MDSMEASANMKRSGQWADRPTLNDQLGFEDYRNSLVKVIWEADTPITIGIFGTWGSGKTSLMRMVQHDVKTGKDGAFRARTVWFDAWKYDKEAALWRVLLLSALETLRADAPGDEQQHLDDLQASLYRDVDRQEAGSLEIDWGQAAKGTVKLGLSLIPLLPALGDFIDAFGAKQKAPGVTGAPKDAVNHLVDTFKRELINIHRDRVQFLDQFQKTFSDLVDRLLPAQSRLVIFIDDLDRCLPEKAIEVLEAIKLFLDAERCVFVVGVERRIIEQGIRVKYQSLAFEAAKQDIPITGEEYLEKIIQIPFYLPPLEQQNIAEFAYQSLADEFARPVADVMARGIEANPRKIKRGLNIFRLLWTLASERGMVEQANSNDAIEADLLAKMVVIQNRWRDLYADVVKYPNLLANLEDHFERRQRELESSPRPESRESEVSEAASLEDSRPEASVRVSPETLVSLYENSDWLMDMLLTPSASRFKGRDVKPYIYLTTTVVDKPASEESDVPADTRIWDDLMSNDPTRIEAAVGRLDDRQKTGYSNRLLAMLTDQKIDSLEPRLSAATALGMLGDPRLGTPPLYQMDMVSIPAGEFLMGSDAGGDNEKPQHTVSLDAFEIARYPLTNRQYKAFLDANPDHNAPDGWNDRMFPAGKANHPVVRISWYDAEAYAEWLSRETGKEYRLPTEAEWEKAARGADGRAYPWEGEFDAAKCNTEGAIGDTTPVGIYPQGASPYGAMDMAGNVWEWCADWYDPAYYNQGENHNPRGPAEGERRVLRGGSWFVPHDYARCAFRYGYRPDGRSSSLGVRFSRTS
jgi:formylglycine-generating enzyme required for sulfatase activity